jgi:predicted dithiol-disulfide oxidoreductase (DUF899 family)
MQNHKVVSREEWLIVRQQHLAKEKEFTRLRDQLSQERRDLPWVKVDKPYIFDGLNGKESLSEVFAGRSQLLVYHFMFGPEWSEAARVARFGRTISIALLSTSTNVTQRWWPSPARRWKNCSPFRSAWGGRSSGSRPTAVILTVTSTSPSQRTTWRKARPTTTTGSARRRLRVKHLVSVCFIEMPAAPSSTPIPATDED